MSALPASYDAWRLQGPPETDEIGTEEGDTCNRVHEPDEDAPRHYRPKPCRGQMIYVDEWSVCNRCGAMT